LFLVIWLLVPISPFTFLIFNFYLHLPTTLRAPTFLATIIYDEIIHPLTG